MVSAERSWRHRRAKRLRRLRRWRDRLLDGKHHLYLVGELRRHDRVLGVTIDKQNVCVVTGWRLLLSNHREMIFRFSGDKVLDSLHKAVVAVYHHLRKRM